MRHEYVARVLFFLRAVPEGWVGADDGSDGVQVVAATPAPQPLRLAACDLSACTQVGDQQQGVAMFRVTDMTAATTRMPVPIHLFERKLAYMGPADMLGATPAAGAAGSKTTYFVPFSIQTD